MEDYCLYYIPPSQDKVNDVLMIDFSDNQKISKREIINNVIVMYVNEEIKGYAITNFSKTCKIKINGNIYLPNNYLVDVINNILSNNKLEKIPYKTSSGFVIGKILEKEKYKNTFIYKVDIKEKIINIESTIDVNVNTLLVVAINGTYLYPGMKLMPYKIRDNVISGGRICTYEDLEMNNNEKYQPLLIDGLEVGSDFFYMEEVNINARD